jgi:hypothetical protein
MSLRITWTRFDPATYEQIATTAQAVRVAMHELPGVQHIHQGVNRTAGTVATVSVKDSKKHACLAHEALGEPIGRLPDGSAVRGTRDRRNHGGRGSGHLTSSRRATTAIHREQALDRAARMRHCLTDRQRLRSARSIMKLVPGL